MSSVNDTQSVGSVVAELVGVLGGGAADGLEAASQAIFDGTAVHGVVGEYDVTTAALSRALRAIKSLAKGQRQADAAEALFMQLVTRVRPLPNVTYCCVACSLMASLPPAHHNIAAQDNGSLASLLALVGRTLRDTTIVGALWSDTATGAASSQHAALVTSELAGTAGATPSDAQAQHTDVRRVRLDDAFARAATPVNDDEARTNDAGSSGGVALASLSTVGARHAVDHTSAGSSVQRKSTAGTPDATPPRHRLRETSTSAGRDAATTSTVGAVRAPAPSRGGDKAGSNIVAPSVTHVQELPSAGLTPPSLVPLNATVKVVAAADAPSVRRAVDARPDSRRITNDPPAAAAATAIAHGENSAVSVGRSRALSSTTTSTTAAVPTSSRTRAPTVDARQGDAVVATRNAGGASRIPSDRNAAGATAHGSVMDIRGAASAAAAASAASAATSARSTLPLNLHQSRDDAPAPRVATETLRPSPAGDAPSTTGETRPQHKNSSASAGAATAPSDARQSRARRGLGDDSGLGGAIGALVALAAAASAAAPRVSSEEPADSDASVLRAGATVYMRASHVAKAGALRCTGGRDGDPATVSAGSAARVAALDGRNPVAALSPQSARARRRAVAMPLVTTHGHVESGVSTGGVCGGDAAEVWHVVLLRPRSDAGDRGAESHPTERSEWVVAAGGDDDRDDVVDAAPSPHQRAALRCGDIVAFRCAATGALLTALSPSQQQSRLRDDAGTGDASTTRFSAPAGATADACAIAAMPLLSGSTLLANDQVGHSPGARVTRDSPVAPSQRWTLLSPDAVASLALNPMNGGGGRAKAPTAATRPLLCAGQRLILLSHARTDGPRDAALRCACLQVSAANATSASPLLAFVDALPLATDALGVIAAARRIVRAADDTADDESITAAVSAAAGSSSAGAVGAAAFALAFAPPPTVLWTLLLAPSRRQSDGSCSAAVSRPHFSSQFDIDVNAIADDIADGAGNGAMPFLQSSTLPSPRHLAVFTRGRRFTAPPAAAPEWSQLRPWLLAPPIAAALLAAAASAARRGAQRLILPAAAGDSGGRASSAARAAPGPVLALRLQQQEAAIVCALIDAAGGQPGEIISADVLAGSALDTASGPLAAAAVLDIAFKFRADGPAMLDESLVGLGSRLLPLGRHYVRCAWFVERCSRGGGGEVVQSLAAAVRALLDEYASLLVRCADEATASVLKLRGAAGMSAAPSPRLQQLVFTLQPSLHTLAALDTLLYGVVIPESAPVSALSGGALLRALDGALRRAGDDATRTLATYLLTSAAAPYLRELERWLWLGELRVGGGDGDDFMVTIREGNSAQPASTWHGVPAFTLCDAASIPPFLARHAPAILRAGKHMHVLRRCAAAEWGAATAAAAARDGGVTVVADRSRSRIAVDGISSLLLPPGSVASNGSLGRDGASSSFGVLMHSAAAAPATPRPLGHAVSPSMASLSVPGEGRPAAGGASGSTPPSHWSRLPPPPPRVIGAVGATPSALKVIEGAIGVTAPVAVDADGSASTSTASTWPFPSRDGQHIIPTPRAAFSVDAEDYRALVTSADEWATRALLKRLWEVEAPLPSPRALHTVHAQVPRLLPLLRSLKSVFLLGSGDFLATFLSTAEAELAKDATVSSTSTPDASAVSPASVPSGRAALSLPRLRALLDSALRSTSLATDPAVWATVDDDVEGISGPKQRRLTACLAPCSVLTQVEATQGTGGPPPRTSPVGLKGYNLFSLSYAPPWPLSIVLHPRAVASYTLIFRHLLFLRVCERAVTGAWAAQQSCKELDLRGTLSPSHALRHRMLHVLGCLAFHVSLEVIEPAWARMEVDATAARSVDELVRAHDAFLRDVLYGCMLTDEPGQGGGDVADGASTSTALATSRPAHLLKLLTKLATLCLLFATQISAAIASHRMSEAELDARAGLNRARVRERAQREEGFYGGGAAGSKGAEAAATATIAGGRRGGADAAPADTSADRVRRAARIGVQSDGMRHTMAQAGWQAMLAKSGRMFDALLRDLLAALAQRAAAEQRRGGSDHHLSHLLARLDFNGYLSRTANTTASTSTTTSTTNSGPPAGGY